MPSADPGPGRPGHQAPLIVGVVALAVYARTLLPGIAFGDWGEMQTVPHVLGVAHPTGYPTYIVLGWFAQLVPVGSVAFRMNFLSAILVATALATVAAIALRLGVRPVLAIAGALSLGAVGTVWAAATVAEVNPLHLLLCAQLIHRALVWEERRRTADLALGGLLIGLALGNHLLTLFVAPFVVLYVLWVGRRELPVRPWILGVPVFAVVAGLSVYAYIPLAAGRSPVLPYNHPMTLDAVWWLVSGRQFRDQFDFLSAKGPGEFFGSLPALVDLALSRATLVVPLLGLAGLGLLLVRRTAFGLLGVGIVVAGVYVWANYLRLEHYLLVPWLVVGIGASVAAEGAARGVAALALRMGRVGRPASPAVGAGLGVVGLAFAVGLAGLNWSAADRSADRSGDEYVAAVLDALPRDAAILSYWDASTPLWHGEYVLGRRPDVLIVDDTNIVYDGWGTRENRIATLICERPVFVLRLDPSDLIPIEKTFDLATFLTVRVAIGGPTAVVDRRIYRVTPRDPATCVARSEGAERPAATGPAVGRRPASAFRVRSAPPPGPGRPLR
jgi:Protein O-mannosyl-transferase TMEM260-like